MADYTSGQHTERDWRTFTDQHNRTWGASCSKKTGHPCGLLEKQFTAPLEVPHKYIKLDAEDSRIVIIDYNQWLRDIDGAVGSWKEKIQDAAMTLGIEGTVQSLIDDPPPAIIRFVGAKPNTKKEPILAAKAGNAWVLGLSTVVPAKAMEFFPEYFEEVKIAEPDADPFAEEQTVDPFAEEEYHAGYSVECPAEEITASVEATDLGDGQWIVDGVRYPVWESPNTGWKLSSGENAVRPEGMEKEDYRALALEQEGALHT